MRRIEAMKIIAEHLGERDLVLVNLGDPCKEFYKIADSPRVFYMLGSLGMVSSIGLGLSLSVKDRRVVVLDGDGSLLYNLGSLVTISRYSPENLYWFVLDNNAHGSTGFQQSYDPRKTDLAEIARAAGIRSVFRAEREDELDRICEEMFKLRGPALAHVRIERSSEKLDPIPLSPLEIRIRFMREISCRGSS